MKINDRKLNKYLQKSSDELVEKLSLELCGIGYKSLPQDSLYQINLEHYKKGAKELLRATQKELFDHFCDKSKLAPKDWVLKMLTGDYKDVIVAVVTTLSSNYHLNLNIALPIAVIMAKEKFKLFCSTVPEQSQKNIKEVINELFPKPFKLSGTLFQAKR